MSSPAESYRAALERQRYANLAAFELTYEFAFDEFQIEACRAVEGGEGVLVAAPTGSGKTVVGEFAVFLALAQGRKAFYTTPIKALSNQKYRDLVARHGAARVGLLTGDQSVNGNAEVVVMTTEVLRNMLYAGSPTLDGLGYVIMDEVHYLADRFRGPVWEEVIIHLAPDVQVVSLSATVSNAEEFGSWLAEVRGNMAVVVSETRPVPLWQHVMVGKEIFDLYAGEKSRLNPDLVDRVRHAARADSPGAPKRPGHRGRRPQHGQRVNRVSKAIPNRVSVIHQLNSRDLLPAIYFIFSRAGCDGAVDQCRDAGLSLTTEDERQRIRSIVSERCSDIPNEDLAVLGYWAWRDALETGIASHHAGLLPVFKETVEALFSAGLVKVVFATETLALGINMPARTVVLEKLVKWNGTSHEAITPGEYTQLTGRAGRRGIDIEGHGVVVYHRDLDPEALSGLASKRTYPLRSSFRPTYNMAVNLIATAGYERARKILEMSFAQYQADRGVVGLAKQVRAHTEALDGYSKAMECDRGIFSEYAALRRAISARESTVAKGRAKRDRRKIEASLDEVRRGDVIEIIAGKRGGFAIVLEANATRFDRARPRVLLADRRVQQIEPADLRAPLRILGRVRLDPRADGRTAPERRDIATTLRNFIAEHGEGAPLIRHPAAPDAGIEKLRDQLAAHPCHSCPEREAHTRWAYRWETLEQENQALIRKIESRTSSIAKVFDRIAVLLRELGYLAEDNSVSPRGMWLRRLYAERDLLLAESLRRGGWDNLDAAELAAIVTTMVFESRRPENARSEVGPQPTPNLLKAVTGAHRIWADLDGLQRGHGLEPTAAIDPGLATPMYLWASGRSLRTVLRSTELTAGDFVRWAKQVLDVLDQLAAAAPSTQVQQRAKEASRLVRRGVVAYTSL